MANATIGNTQQVSEEVLDALFLLNASLLLRGSEETCFRQVCVMARLFGYVEHANSPLEELRNHQHNLRKLISAVKSA